MYVRANRSIFGVCFLVVMDVIFKFKCIWWPFVIFLFCFGWLACTPVLLFLLFLRKKHSQQAARITPDC